MFGLFDGEVSDETCEAVRVALDAADLRRVHMVRYQDPGSSRLRGWFTWSNLGAPFDAALARETRAVLDAAGITLPWRRA